MPKTFEILMGFALTTLGGGLLTFLFQRLSWKRQARLETFRQRYADGLRFSGELTRLIDRRFYRVQRLVWALEQTGGPDKLSAAELRYFETVHEWNENLRSNASYINVLVGQTLGKQFLSYEDDDRLEYPRSLHYKFVVTHRAVMAARNNRELIGRASQAVVVLNVDVSEFCLELTRAFQRSPLDKFS